MIGNTNTKTVNNINYNIYYKEIAKIQVIDYDGTIIDSQDLNINSEYILPEPPIHDGLTFQNWVSTEVISNNKITISKSYILVGAIYTTTSGKNEFEIELNENTGLTINLNMNGTKEWGDNTSNTNTSHTYSNYGTYIIKCNGTAITSSTNSGLFGQSSNNINYYLKSARLIISEVSAYSFQYCYNLKSIMLNNNITSLKEYAFQCCYYLCSINIPNSVTSTSSNLFRYCCCLKSVVIPKSLIDIATTVMFYSCPSIDLVVLPPINNVISTQMFTDCSTLKIIDFLKFNSVPTLSNTNSFSGVYPIYKILVPWDLYQNWIVATNWTTIKDHIYGGIPAIITFTGVTPSINLYVNNNLISDTTIEWFGSNMPYYCYNPSNNTVLPTQIETGIIEADSRTINIDLSTYNTITLSTGISEMNVVFTIDGNNYNATVNNSNYSINVVGSDIEIDYTISKIGYLTKSDIITTTGSNITINLNYGKLTLSTGVSGLSVSFIYDNASNDAIDDNGDYYLYISGSGESIEYYIDGGNNYMDNSGTITTTGSNITQNITLTTATTSTFSRPNLTANGTLGGSAFAVDAIAYSTSTSYQAWRAVDSSTSTSYYWYSKSGGGEYTFYNPNVLNVTELTYKYSGTAYRAKEINIQGSNDGTTWQNIESTYSGSSTTYTSTLNNNKYYKYYKLAFIPNSTYIRLIDLAITATQKVPV